MHRMAHSVVEDFHASVVFCLEDFHATSHFQHHAFGEWAFLSKKVFLRAGLLPFVRSAMEYLRGKEDDVAGILLAHKLLQCLMQQPQLCLYRKSCK